MQEKRYPECRETDEAKLFSSYYGVRTSLLNAFCAYIPTINSLMFELLVMVAKIVVMLNDIAKILNDVLFKSHQTYRTTIGNNQFWERKMQIDTHPYKFLISILVQRSIFDRKYLWFVYHIVISSFWLIFIYWFSACVAGWEVCQLDQIEVNHIIIALT